MLILGIETSGLSGSIALADDNRPLCEKHLNQEGRRHAQSLVLEVDTLLRTHGTTSKDIGLIAVSRGPGSFTGLRVGMTFAKTFAYATRCRFSAVDTFAAIAENLPDGVADVQIIEDAQRNDLFVAEFRRDDAGAWERVSDTRTMSVEQFAQLQSPSKSVTGPGVTKLRSVRISAHVFDDPIFRHPRAAMIAENGRKVSHSTRPQTADDNFWTASPYYVRPSAAEEKRSLTGQSR